MSEQEHKVCEWRSESMAVRDFASFDGKTQSQGHIKPVHWYIACRLVVEGGFLPEELTPRPPLVAEQHKKTYRLHYDQSVANGSEQTILGGLKTKDVDVVVDKRGIGPVLAVSCKGMTGALRNLTNRMEETVGECTNLHITYPALVFGYLFLIRGNRAEAERASEATRGDTDEQRRLAKADVALGKDDTPVAALVRFHYALSQMAGRKGVRDDLSRYEAVALGVTTEDGALLNSFPPIESKVRMDAFFQTLYQRYEERFVFTGAALKQTTRRHVWARESPLFGENSGLPFPIDYRPLTQIEE